MKGKDELRDKLEVFIRKYYQNRLIKGVLYGIGLSLSYFFILGMVEYFGTFPGEVRFLLFIALLLGLAVIIGYHIVYPITKLVGIGRRISYEKAAVLIGRYFPEIDDKITNTLQLQQASHGELELIKASIEQRITELKPVPFQTAIDFKENRKYWPILVIPVLIFLGVFITGFWDDFSESSKRIAAYNQDFVAPAPFDFNLKTESLVVEQGENLLLELGFLGDNLPKDASIMLPAGENRMTRNAKGNFEFTFNNLQESFEFRFEAAGYQSRLYNVDVIPVPQVNAFTLRVYPPMYTNIKPFETEAKLVQDIPEGSSVEWSLSVKQAKKAYLLLDSNEIEFNQEGVQYAVKQTIRTNTSYSVLTSNDLIEKVSIRDNQLKVIKDQYPGIKVQFNRDSLNSEVLYYSGSISDDYGFSRLSLVLEIEGKKVSSNVPINKGSVGQNIGSLIILDSLLSEKSKKVKVYLEVRDNDGVNGPKLSRSEVYILELLGVNERKERLNEEYENYFGSSEQNQKEQQEIQTTLEELQERLRDKKNLSWKEKNQIKELLNKQQELLEKQRMNQEKLKELQKEEEQLKDKPEEIKKKEEQIQKLNEDQKDLEELMKEIERLMEELDTDKLRKKLEEFQKANEENSQMEMRQEDLLKDLQFQKDILEQAQKLKELGDKMKELSEKSEENRKDKDQKGDDSQDSEAQNEMEQQEEIQKELDEAMKKIESLREENSKFDKSSDKQQLDEKKEEIDKKMQEAGDKLQKNQQQPANQDQKDAGEQMEDLSQSLQMAMIEMQAENNQENMETLRQILENLETLSFDIEALSERSQEADKNDPSFKALLTEQKRLKDGAAIIEDSLVALSRRVPQLEQIVFRELELINSNLDKGIQSLEELQNAQAASRQQYVMTSANNLALLLDETMQQMQQMQAQMMKGKQNCQKPGGGNPKPSMSNMRKLQNELGQQMNQMKKGQKEGEGEPEKGRNGKEIVEMLSRQEKIRRALEEMQNEDGAGGSSGDLQKAIEEMKKLEEDLLDGELNDNYKERLKEINTRLLESEKAEMEQKKDEKRQSQTADELNQIYREELEKYLQEKQVEQESIDRLPLNFKHYYKDKTSQYLNQL